MPILPGIEPYLSDPIDFGFFGAPDLHSSPAIGLSRVSP